MSSVFPCSFFSRQKLELLLLIAIPIATSPFQGPSACGKNDWQLAGCAQWCANIKNYCKEQERCFRNTLRKWRRMQNAILLSLILLLGCNLCCCVAADRWLSLSCLDFFFFIFHYHIMLLVFSSFLVVLPLNILGNVSCLGYFWRKKKRYTKKCKEQGNWIKTPLHKTLSESMSQQIEVNPTIPVNIHALN